MSWGRSVFLSVYLFVSPDIPHAGLPQTFFSLLKKEKLFEYVDGRTPE